MRVLVVFVVTLALAAGGSAQQAQQPHCLPTDTPNQCWTKFVPAVAPAQPAAPMTKDEMQSTVAAANTGTTNLASPAGSSLKDFLSAFSASLESSTVTDNGNTLTLDSNFPVPIGPDSQTVKFQLAINNAELDPQIVQKLGSNAAQVSALEDSLSSTDDLVASVSYSPATPGLGRSIQPHGDFFDALVAAAFPTQSALDEARRTAIHTANITDASRPFSEIADDSAEAAALQVFQSSASAIGNALRTTDAMRSAFASLLSNQPQAFGSVLYHYRSDLVGPNEYALKGTLEASSRNLRSFYKLYTNCTPAAFRNLPAANRMTTAADCLTKMQQYAAPIAAKESGTRLSFSVEYRKSNARSYTLPENAGVVTNDQATSTTATLVLGLIPIKTSDTTSGRIDVSASYEDVSGDPLRDNRFVASATYTQKINDMLTIPISLVYANRDQYLSNVDSKLNAHFGLIYKLPTR